MIVPVESRGTVKVMVAVPRALASAFVIGGVSFAALRLAVNVIGPVLPPPDGVVGLSLPHAVIIKATVTMLPVFSSDVSSIWNRVKGPRIRDPQCASRACFSYVASHFRVTADCLPFTTAHPTFRASRIAHRAPGLAHRGSRTAALKPPDQVEPQISVVCAAAARDLTEGGAERVREIQLERVAAGQLLDRDPPVGAAGS